MRSLANITILIITIALLVVTQFSCKPKHAFDINQVGLQCYKSITRATPEKPMEVEEYLYLKILEDTVTGYSEGNAQSGDLKFSWNGVLKGNFYNGELVVLEETKIEGVVQKVQRGYKLIDNQLTEYEGRRKEESDGIQYLMEGGDFTKQWKEIKCE